LRRRWKKGEKGRRRIRRTTTEAAAAGLSKV